MDQNGRSIKGIKHRTKYVSMSGTGYSVEHTFVAGMPVMDVAGLRRAVELGGAKGERAKAKLRILAKDSYKCVSCGSPDNLTIDHMRYPKDRRMTRQLAKDFPVDECQTLCAFCHKEKNRKNGLVYMNCADCGKRIQFGTNNEPENLGFCFVCESAKEKEAEAQKEEALRVLEEERKKAEEENNGEVLSDKGD
jgi:DNA-directed RNA polymerase subunit RPC12/RpoP